MNCRRVEAFADGVFAIAATLLILNVDDRIDRRFLLTTVGLLMCIALYAAITVFFVVESSVFGRSTAELET